MNPDIPTEGHVPAGQVTDACRVRQLNTVPTCSSHHAAAPAAAAASIQRQARPYMQQLQAFHTSDYGCVVVRLPPNLVIQLALPGAPLRQHGQAGARRFSRALLWASTTAHRGQPGRQAEDGQAGSQGQARHLHDGCLFVGRHHHSVEVGQVDGEDTGCCAIAHI